MSYESYLKHLIEVKESPLFKQWSDDSFDCIGNKSSPIELLLLGALRYLGRGWTLDDLEEQTTISEETHRRFFHVYIRWGSTYLHEKYVCMPSTAEEISDSSCKFYIAGLPGALEAKMPHILV